MDIPPILQIGDVLISSDLITECFCCDLQACKGACCIEGDAGAPVTLEEIGQMEDGLDTVWPSLSASAQSVIDRQGVAYTDRDGDLVTSIVGGKDCVFTCYDDLRLDDGTTAAHCCLCAFERAFRSGSSRFCKPASCALYPVRARQFSDGTWGLNYHQWDICRPAREKGKALRLPLYRFLEQPLTQRFGREWYAELCSVASAVLSE